MTVDDGSWTNNRNDSLIETEYSFGPTRIGQAGKTAPYLWVLSVEHASQSGALNFVVALKCLENVCNPGYANLIDVAVTISCPVDIIVHIIHLLRPLFCIVYMLSTSVTRVLTYKQGYRDTLGICNNYCSSTATLVKRTRLNITLYVVC